MFERTTSSRPAMGRHEDEVAELCRAVLTAGGVTTPEDRRAAFDGTEVAGPWNAYIAKVRHASYRLTDDDIEDLLAAGRSEDAVLEMTLAAALGAASHRLDAGMRALRGSG